MKNVTKLEALRLIESNLKSIKGGAKETFDRSIKPESGEAGDNVGLLFNESKG